MASSDQELLDLARAGDQRAFRLLVERFEPKVAATVVGMLGRVPEADDVGQEVFVRFYRSMDKFRGEAGLGTYLTRIAINQSIKALKRRQSWMKRFTTIDAAIESRGATDDHLERAEQTEIVERALSRLSPDHRAVVVLRLIEGYSTRETAGILGVPEGTVMSRLSRSVDALGRILRPQVENTT
jgi:RNA polymerase sigma-70 factor (ECF subfamily)